MGQKMSNTHELSHAMKKMRLTNLASCADDKGETVNFGSVVDTYSPCSPFRKGANRQVNLLEDACHATFENQSSSNSVEAAEEYAEVNDCEWSGDGGIVPVLSITKVHAELHLEDLPEDGCRQLRSSTESLHNRYDDKCDDLYSNEELLCFLKACEKDIERFHRDASLVVYYGGSSLLVEEKSAEKAFKSVQSYEPSDEEMIHHLKRK